MACVWFSARHSILADKLAIFNPGFYQRDFFPGYNTSRSQRLIARVHIVRDCLGFSGELNFFKNRYDATVIKVSRDFFLKISKQIVCISLLKAFRSVKRDAIAKLPKAPLGNKAAPACLARKLTKLGKYNSGNALGNHQVL